MADSVIKIDVRPLVQFLDRVQTRNKAVAAKRAGERHVELIQEAFSRGGVDPETGTPGVWKPKVIPSGKVGGKARRFDPTPRLQDTGRLLGSIQARLFGGGYEIGPEPIPYAAVHQFGAIIPISPAMRRVLRGMGFRISSAKTSVVIPARPYIVMPRPWQREIAELYAATLMENSDAN